MANAQTVIAMMQDAQRIQASGNRAEADRYAAQAAQIASSLGNVQLHAAVVNHANSWGPAPAPAPAPGPTHTPQPAPTGPRPLSAAEIQALIRAEAERAAAAERERRRTNVFDEAKRLFQDWGMDMDGSFTNQLRDWVWNDWSNDRIIMEFRKTNTYNNRFTGMKRLIERGQFMNEAQYIQLERSYRNLMNQWDLPKGFYDSYDDFGDFIANGVSVAELDDRIESAKTLLDNDTDPAYRQALREMGAGDGDLLAYVIDGNKAQNLIQRKLRASAIAGAARGAGFDQGDVSWRDFEKYQGALGEEYNDINGKELVELQMRMGITGLAADRDEFLSSLEGDTTFRKSDLLDADLLGDTEKMLASQRRAERDKNRFGKKSGVGRNALGTASDNRGV